MSVTQLIPWNRDRNSLATVGKRDPFFSLQREVNRLFDEIWNDFDLPLARSRGTLAGSWPQIDLVEQDKDFVLTVEVPGLDEKDIDLQFADQCLILRGERHVDNQQNTKDYHYSERHYGRFERRIPLSADIECDKAKAVLADGVLTVTLPKAAQAREIGHRIEITKAA